MILDDSKSTDESVFSPKSDPFAKFPYKLLFLSYFPYNQTDSKT